MSDLLRGKCQAWPKVTLASLVILLAGFAATRLPDISGPDVPLVNSFYADFNNELPSHFSFNPSIIRYDSNGKIGEGARIKKVAGVASTILETTGTVLNARRGSCTFWVRLNSSVTDGPTELITEFPGIPLIDI